MGQIMGMRTNPMFDLRRNRHGQADRRKAECVHEAGDVLGRRNIVPSRGAGRIEVVDSVPPPVVDLNAQLSQGRRSLSDGVSSEILDALGPRPPRVDETCECKGRVKVRQVLTLRAERGSLRHVAKR